MRCFVGWTLAERLCDPEVGAVMGRVVPHNVGASLLSGLLELELEVMRVGRGRQRLGDDVRPALGARGDEEELRPGEELEGALARAGRPLTKGLGRAWVYFWVLAPLPLLFHRPFLAGVLWPLIGIDAT